MKKNLLQNLIPLDNKWAMALDFPQISAMRSQNPTDSREIFGKFHPTTKK